MSIQSLQVLVALLVVSYPVSLLIVWWRAAARGARDLRDLRQKLEDEAAQTFLTETRLLAERVTELQVQVEQAREVAGEAQAREKRYFLKISEFERERDKWQRSYFEQSAGHGTAQQLMLVCIETMAKKLQSMGVNAQIPQVILAVRGEFERAHEQPSREALAALEAAKAQVAATSAAAAETAPVPNP